jgi:3-oxoacyl-[acyl-carrier-protein] synthase III
MMTLSPNASRFSGVAATGRYLPATVVRNEDLQFPRNAIPMIAAKTGIRERRYAADGECTSDLAAAAGRDCLTKARVAADQVSAIIVSTSSPDRIQPPTAARVQDLLGARNAFAFDMNAVCSGAIYAVHTADGLIRAGHTRILVIAAEVYSRILNRQDFSTAPYFGDGAGAVLLETSETPHITGTVLHTDGSGADVIRVPGGGSMLPYPKLERPEDVYFTMRGKDVFEFAVRRGADAIDESLQRAGLRRADIQLFIPHQANENIIRGIAEKLGIPYDDFYLNLDRYGNTASASVLIALDEALETGRLQRGGRALLVAFGGGLAWGAMVVQF